MPRLWVTEYARIARDEQGEALPAALEPAIRCFALEIGRGAISEALALTTRFVRLHCDAPCHVAFGEGEDLKATREDTRLSADQTEFFGCRTPLRIAVIAAEGLTP